MVDKSLLLVFLGPPEDLRKMTGKNKLDASHDETSFTGLIPPPLQSPRPKSEKVNSQPKLL